MAEPSFGQARHSGGPDDTAGSITFDGKELLDPATRHSSTKAYEGLRGEQIARLHQGGL